MELEILKEKIISSSSINEACAKIYGNNNHANRQRIKKFINENDLDISHITKNKRGTKKKRTLKEILVVNSTYSRTNLKARLYKVGLKERKCEKCGQDELWNLGIDRILSVHRT